MSKKHEHDLYLGFMVVFLGTLMTIGFLFFVNGLESLNHFKVATGGSIVFLDTIALYFYGKTVRKLR